jgi:hypothetical protein
MLSTSLDERTRNSGCVRTPFRRRTSVSFGRTRDEREGVGKSPFDMHRRYVLFFYLT